MRLFLKILRTILPLVILIVCSVLVWWLLANPPEQKKVEIPPSLVRVEGTVLHKTRFQLHVRSQGTVRPRTRSTLVPEVSGKIIEVGATFRPGGFFAKGDVLLKLDPVDYETAKIVAQAAQAQAEVVLAEEQARAAQARENWKSMGRAGAPSSLLVRVPQVAKAEADVAAAKAQVQKADRDLERTMIRAPYDGQVLEQSVDVGQFVSPGTTVGQIFAVDYVEVRLPLPERESQFLNLPQPFRDAPGSVTPARVLLKATIAGKPIAWEGAVVRVEGSLDEQTRQVTAVAQVIDPYARRADGAPPLTIGAFVEAEIIGDDLEDVFVIPRNAVRAGNEIILIDRPENTLRRMNVDPLVSNEKHIVVAANAPKAPKEGDVLCLTPIPFPADGARVLPSIDGEVEGAPMPRAPLVPKKAPVVSQGAR